MFRISAAVAGLLLLLLGWLLFRVLTARNDLNTARSHLVAARAALTNRDAPLAAREADAAARETSSARRAVNDPVVRAAATVPLLGRSLVAVRGVARAADETVTSVVQPLVTIVERLKPEQLRRPDGSIDLALLQSLQPKLDQVARRSQAIAKRTAGLPRSLVFGPVGHATGEFNTQLKALNSLVQKTDLGVRIAPAMLGATRPMRYFVMLQQLGESRGTGGLIGGFAVLRADHGRLTVEAEGTDKDLRNGPVPPSSDIPKDFVESYRYSGTFDIWQNVNLSPDLPTVAKVIRDRWRHQTGRVIDGVIATDGTSLADLLQGQPPLVLPGRTVPISELEHYLAIDQYADIADPNLRKDKLTIVAHDALQELVGGGGASDDLLKGAGSAIRSGHLHVASLDSSLGRSLQRLGIDGGLPEGTAPIAYAVVNNGAGSKLDYFLNRSVTYEIGDCQGGRRNTTIKLTLTNQATQSDTLPAYVTSHPIAGTPGGHSSTNRSLVTVYATPGAVLRSGRLDDQVVSTVAGRTLQQLATGREGGLPFWSLSFDLPPGKPKTFSLRLSEPLAAGEVRMPRQPAARLASQRVVSRNC